MPEYTRLGADTTWADADVISPHWMCNDCGADVANCDLHSHWHGQVALGTDLQHEVQVRGDSDQWITEQREALQSRVEQLEDAVTELQKSLKVLMEQHVEGGNHAPVSPQTHLHALWPHTHSVFLGREETVDG